MTDTSNPRPLPDDGRQPIGANAAAWALLLSALWGGTPVAIKYSVGTLGPFAVAGLRFAMAALFLFVWCRWERTRLRLNSGQLFPVGVLGVLLYLQIGTFTVGVDWSNASHGTLFINTFVFWVVVVDQFVMRTDRLSWSRWIGLLLAAAGVLLVLSHPDASPNQRVTEFQADLPTFAGDALLLISGLLLGIKIVYTKAVVRTVEPNTLIFWHDVVGVVLFAATSLAIEQTTPGQFTAPAVLGLLYQGVVVAGFCFAMQARLLRKHSASGLAVFSFATPLFGVTLAVLFRGEDLSPWLAISAVCVAVGIYLVNATSKPDR